MSKKRRRSSELEVQAEEDRPARRRRLGSSSGGWDVPDDLFRRVSEDERERTTTSLFSHLRPTCVSRCTMPFAASETPTTGCCVST